MRKILTISLITGVVLLLTWFLPENGERSAREKNFDPSLSLNTYLQHKEHKRKNGYAKMDAPEMHARMEKLRRIPIDKQEPEYSENYLVEEYKKLKSQKGGQNMRVANTLEFIERGPGNVGGRTRGLIVDPDDPTHNTWFAGSASGGIWKTEDAGQSWTLISQDIPNLGTNTLAMSDANTQVIYAGTGEHFTDAIDGSGMFKSTDKGQSWFQIASPDDFSDFKNISRIIVDPNDENVVLATTRTSVWGSDFRSSIYKSTDGGENWTQVYTSTQFRLDDLDYEPGNFSVMYAALQNKGVIKSIDGGETWEETGPGMNPGGRVEITVSPVNTQYIWASAQGSETGTGSDLYLSKDGGDTWSLLVEENGNDIHFLGGQGWYDNIITAHPFDENIVYVGGVNTFKFTLGEGTVTREVLDVEEDGTGAFLAFINFSAAYNGGTLDIGDVPFEDLVSVEVRFGVGTQKAHRFTVNKRGSGVPDADYEYEDYVEVPFQVWDVTNDQQLMVSFRDQQEDGEWNLITQNTNEGDEENHSREYVFIHSTPYSDQENATIAQNAGHATNQQYFFWPILANGADFDKENLPESTLRISKLSFEGSEKTIEIVSDAYNEYNSNNNFSNNDVVNGTGLHPDQHNIVMIVEDEAEKTFRMLIANDGGIYLSETKDDPALTDNTFTFSSTGFNTTQFYGADKAPGENRYIGGMQDNSTWFTPEGQEGSATTDYTFAFGGDGFEAIWNNRNPDLLIGSIQFNAFRRSTDGGNSWAGATNGITDDGPFYSRLANSKALPDRIFTVGSSGVWKSEDFGASWTGTPISNQWSFNSRTDITVSDADPDYIWAGGNLSQNQRIFVSTDAGETFSPVNNYNGTPLGFCSGLGTHPVDPNIGYALFSFAGRPKVLKTTDLGQTWEDISGFEGNNGVSDRGFPDVAVNCILVFPNDPDRIWVGSELGIVESFDGGTTWSYRAEMPPVNVYEFKIQDDQVVIATYGRGIWSVTIPEVEQEILFAPEVRNAGTTPSGDVNFEFTYTSVFDSSLVFVDNEKVLTLEENEKGRIQQLIDDLGIYGNVTVRIDAYKDGSLYSSEEFQAFLFEIDPITNEYAANFSTLGSGNDFVGSGFSVLIEPNFSNEALHSPHNYPSNANISYQLKAPIIVSEENSMMTYKDVALIEPGDPGAVFGDQNFWDYVVVEGSKNGLNWLPLKDGYDANFETAWLGNFNGGNPGREDLMLNQEIDLRDTFNAGDTIFLRFRLFSDEVIEGWGWAIDNIRIQSTQEFEEVLSLEDTKDQWSVYPNPVEDQFSIEYRLNGENGVATLRTLSGKLVNKIALEGNEGKIKVSRAGLTKGIYLLQIRSSSDVSTKKLIFK